MGTATNKFNPGDIIHHRRYDYRGVIVGWDPSCQADGQWYRSNQTQPDRDQPWYHVLVDGSDATTYAAQENLEPATDTGEITHPLLKEVFASYYKGRYYKESLN